jgi:hypothetical protein
MKNKKDRFKLKGQSILNSRPNSMKDFLEGRKDVQIHKNSTAQLDKPTKAQLHKTVPAQNRNHPDVPGKSNQNTDERIHVHIRKDLADKLIEMVYARKRAGKSKRNASQRHIIEEALDEYFKK